MLCSFVLALAGACATPLDPQTQAALEAEGAYSDDAGAADDIEVDSLSQPLPGVPASEGFLRATQPTTATYYPSTSVSYNSAGGANKITRLGTGRYRIDMPRLSAPGNAQVTSYGATSNRCNLHARPYAANSGVRFDVNCFTRTGTPADTTFMAFYQNSGDYDGEEAFGTVLGTTLYDGAYAGTVTPIGMYTQPTVAGVYRIALHDSISPRASAFVTSLGSTGAYCNPFSLGRDTTGNRLLVYCFAKNGTRAEASFSFLVMNESRWPQITSAAATSTVMSGDQAVDAYYSRTAAWEQAYFYRKVAGRYSSSFYDVGVNGASIALANARLPGALYCVPGEPRAGTASYDVSVVCYQPDGVVADTNRSVALIGRYPSVTAPPSKQ
jgi:hypothetical protein